VAPTDNLRIGRSAAVESGTLRGPPRIETIPKTISARTGGISDGAIATGAARGHGKQADHGQQNDDNFIHGQIAVVSLVPYPPIGTLES
jgi:hypothetical protein